MKALVGAFNQEKALVGAFSVIVKTDCETDGSSAALLLITAGGQASFPRLQRAVCKCQPSCSVSGLDQALQCRHATGRGHNSDITSSVRKDFTINNYGEGLLLVERIYSIKTLNRCLNTVSRREFGTPTQRS